MAPGKRRTMLVRELGRTREYLLSAEWLAWAMEQPVGIRSRAAMLLMSVEASRLALLDAELAAIRDELAAIEPALAVDVEALAAARDRPAPSERPLGIIADLLAHISRLAPTWPLL